MSKFVGGEAEGLKSKNCLIGRIDMTGFHLFDLVCRLSKDPNFKYTFWEFQLFNSMATPSPPLTTPKNNYVGDF